MRHVVRFSGGEGSWAAAKRVAAQHGTADLVLLFTDPREEDEDLYRFLIEGAANVFGVRRERVAHLARRALALTPVEAGDQPRRLAELAALQADAVAAIPGLVWIADGRTPWDVFRDERYIGNTRADPCSRVLKRELADAWLDANRDPAETVVHVGIDWTEEHRYTRLRDRRALAGWTYRAPLCEPPLIAKPDVAALLAAEGIRRPRLYTEGFSHNNCGGFCVKAGQAHFATLLRQRPERYAHHEAQEEAARTRLGKDVAILRDRTGGTARPLTLRAFRERVQRGAEFDLFEFGGCGCAVDVPDVEPLAIAEPRSVV